MSTADLIQSLLLLVASIALMLNFWLLAVSNKQKRVEYIRGIYNQCLSDPSITKMYYDIEYRRFGYTPAFHGSPEEINLDKLLNLYDSVAKIYQMQNMSIEDLDYIAYDFLTVYRYPAIREYIEVLSGYHKSKKVSVGPFDSFQQVGKLLDTHHSKRTPK